MRCVNAIACYWLFTWKAEFALIYCRGFLMMGIRCERTQCCTVALWDFTVSQLFSNFPPLMEVARRFITVVIKPRKWSLFLFFFFYAGQRPNSDPGGLIVEVSRSHTHPVGLLCTSDQTVSEAANSITHNRHNRRKFMPSAGFETALPVMKRL